MTKYTGREIAIFTDIHGLLEPTIAILNDIKKRGINEIYSLGDNIGVGPNPSEVLDLLDEYDVKSINGNSEDYLTIGTEPYYMVINGQLKVFSEVQEKNNYESSEKCGVETIKKLDKKNNR